MPKSVITKWREDRSINQMIKSSSSESEHGIMNIKHMHEEENYCVNDSFTHTENSSYNYISSTETESNSNEGHFENTNESSLRQDVTGNIITLVWKKELYNAYYKIHFLEIKLS